MVKSGTVDRESAKSQFEYLRGREKDVEDEEVEDFEEIRPRPDDEFSASPMHQPVYSEGFVLGLVHICLCI